MNNETFKVDNVEYGIGLNEKGYPCIFRLDGNTIHKQKRIVKKALLEECDIEIQKDDNRTTHELIYELSKQLGGDLEKKVNENNL